MTRYFMTIPEAVQLVIRSGSLVTGGEVFVLEMGEPVKIIDLARDMIRLSGLEPERDIAIEVIGPRPGEKLHEELFNRYERAQPTPAQKIVRADHPRLDPGLGAGDVRPDQLPRARRRRRRAGRQGGRARDRAPGAAGGPARPSSHVAAGTAPRLHASFQWSGSPSPSRTRSRSTASTWGSPPSSALPSSPCCTSRRPAS